MLLGGRAAHPYWKECYCNELASKSRIGSCAVASFAFIIEAMNRSQINR
jgi:hypothetical protein